VVAEVTGCRLPRWAIATAVLGAFSLIMVLICLSILLISAQNNLDEQRKDASCRADVTLEINLGTAVRRRRTRPCPPGPCPRGQSPLAPARRSRRRRSAPEEQELRLRRVHPDADQRQTMILLIPRSAP
jgi:hypothetical protein